MMYGLERIVLNMRHTVRSWGTMVSVDQPKWNPLPADTGIIVLIFFLSFVFHYCHQWEIIYFSAQLLVLFPKDHFKKPLLSTSGRLRKIRPVVERMVWMVESHPSPKDFSGKTPLYSDVHVTYLKARMICYLLKLHYCPGKVGILPFVWMKNFRPCKLASSLALAP